MGNSLAGLRVVVDVQHLFRPPPHAGDHGTDFVLAASGAHVAEADCALLYAHALAAAMRAQAAIVIENDARTGMMCGPYSRRNRTAGNLGANAYLACHLNAGRGDYALTESLSLNPGLELGRAIGLRLVRNFGAIEESQVRTLHEGDRGVVCIRECPSRCAAVILEPLFGDNPRHQALMLAPRLVQLGETIAQGVADWWVSRHLTVTPGPA